MVFLLCSVWLLSPESSVSFFSRLLSGFVQPKLTKASGFFQVLHWVSSTRSGLCIHRVDLLRPVVRTLTWRFLTCFLQALSGFIHSQTKLTEVSGCCRLCFCLVSFIARPNYQRSVCLLWALSLSGFLHPQTKLKEVSACSILSAFLNLQTKPKGQWFCPGSVCFPHSRLIGVVNPLKKNPRQNICDHRVVYLYQMINVSAFLTGDFSVHQSKKLSLSRTSEVCTDLKIPVPDPILFTGDSAMVKTPERNNQFNDYVFAKTICQTSLFFIQTHVGLQCINCSVKHVFLGRQQFFDNFVLIGSEVVCVFFFFFVGFFLLDRVSTLVYHLALKTSDETCMGTLVLYVQA